ncbi:NAD(P)-dependent oxidoreductase [Demequina lignilytica]|uniref:NAD(P)-dependent oxidoreductase n=1 Tax=Demequina lignilytica TaxID=3051663 RepID=A0AB35MJB6_9MICO|nr:NAD(P)-dependent oxidoreductase [Demequina sp. SYSU T0a273]MDN4483897.1 NAD(P)-dependent oxidoreductase [Demequina sp. SYSU T0a273]
MPTGTLSDTPATLTVAVLGTGIMGSAMARTMVRAGHRVRVWNRTHARAAELAADGATVAVTAAEAVHEADVILSMLHDGDTVTEVMRLAAPGVRPGAVWIQSSTVGVEAQRAIAELARELEVVLVDAPVLGTREPAEAGQLTVLAAGADEARPVAQAVFDAVAARTVWTGDDAAAGSAQALKLVVNSWVLAVNNAVGESVALAAGLGVDPRLLLDAVAGGGLDMGYLRLKAGLILDERLSPASFATETAAKDADLIVDAAARAGVRVDALAAAGGRLHRAVGGGHGSEDMAAAYFASFEG